MAKPVWFPFYVNDFLSSSKVKLMSNEERGGYLLLLCHEWNDPRCHLPDDDTAIRKLSELNGDLSLIKSCFKSKKGFLYNERLYSEWLKVKEKSDLAKHSSEMRWASERNANAMRTHNRTLSSSHRNIRTSEQKNRRTEEPSELQSEEEKNLVEVPRERSTTPKSAGIWEAYRSAYRHRYGVDPVRNRSVNIGLCQVIDKLGAEDAPAVAAYYVTHNGQWYVTKMHPVNLLVVDAEKLRTEWATNRQVTTTQARQVDGKQTRGAVWNKLIEEAERKEQA